MKRHGAQILPFSDPCANDTGSGYVITTCSKTEERLFFTQRYRTAAFFIGSQGSDGSDFYFPPQSSSACPVIMARSSES
jgi:hypothetical protein